MRSQSLLASIVVTIVITDAALSRAEPSPESEVTPRLAVGTDPVGLVTGRYALSVAFVTSAHAAIRGDLTVEESNPIATRDEWRASLGLPLYLDRPFQGPFVEPGVALAHQRVYSGIGVLGPEPSMSTVIGLTYRESIEPQVFVGWQWLGGARWHIAAAIGAARVSTGDGSHVAIPQSYLRVGVAL